MLRRIILGIPILLGLFSCSSSQKNEAFVEQPGLDSLLASFYQDYLKFAPLNATIIGDNRYDDKLPNVEKIPATEMITSSSGAMENTV